jgi:hypothetical protein
VAAEKDEIKIRKLLVNKRTEFLLSAKLNACHAGILRWLVEEAESIKLEEALKTSAKNA